MSYKTLKIITILIPTLLIGGFEFLRHSVLLHHLSMETGNYFITFLTFIVFFVYTTWMFKTIAEKNQRISAEREMRAIYEERERLAKELHDNIAQTLFLLNVNLKKGKINEASSLVNSIDANVRQAIYNLRINPIDINSFPERIENWIESWSAVSGIDSKVIFDVKDGYFSPAEEVELFGIIQEVYTNIRKHSNAVSAILILKTIPDGWEMTIEDNGQGFLTADVGGNHYGLQILLERAHKIKATMDITSEPNVGTIITIKGRR